MIKLNKVERIGKELFERNHNCNWFNKLISFESVYFKIKEYKTEIGLKKVIKCMCCKETFDITDYSKW